MKLCVQVCTHNMRHDRDDVVVQSDSDDVISSGQDSEMKFSSVNGTRERERDLSYGVCLHDALQKIMFHSRFGSSGIDLFTRE